MRGGMKVRPPVQGQVSAASRTSDTKSKRVRMCLGSRGWACGKYSNCALRIGRCWVWALWRGPRYSFEALLLPLALRAIPLVMRGRRRCSCSALFSRSYPTEEQTGPRGGEASGAPLVRSASGRGRSLCLCTPWRVELPAEHLRGIIIY